MLIFSKPAERLYLEKDGGSDIYTKLYKKLPQHQIDGIRFLYRQFKKKTPGVILNDPSGYGKCLQTVLFLNALRPVLKKPVLILSNSVDNWKDNFETWTECTDELSINSANIFSKKLFQIAPVKEGLNFARRTWSIVILHDEDCTKEFLYMTFNADYKIWITSKDLKENLQTLSSIYEWLYPNHKFNIQGFTAKKGNRRDAVEKAILLDAFLEDFFLRRSDFKTPFTKPEHFKPASVPLVKATLKNKDPTGTKVKRSKKRRIEEDSIDDQSEINLNGSNVSGNGSTTNNGEDKMDTDNFVQDKKKVTADSIQDSNESTQTICVTVKIPDKDYKDLKNSIKKCVEQEKNAEKDDKNVCVDTQGDLRKIETQGTNDAEFDKKSNVLVPETEDCNDSQSIFLYNETLQDNLTESTNINTNNVKEGIVVPETENSEDLLKKEQDDFAQSVTMDLNVPDVIKTNENIIEEIKGENGDNSKKNEIEDNMNSRDSEMKHDYGGNALEAKLAELEASALRRFKGSFLDRMFKM